MMKLIRHHPHACIEVDLCEVTVIDVTSTRQSLRNILVIRCNSDWEIALGSVLDAYLTAISHVVTYTSRLSCFVCFLTYFLVQRTPSNG